MLIFKKPPYRNIVRVQRLMTVLHSEDADWCVSMTTTEKKGKGGGWGRAERREEVERGRK